MISVGQEYLIHISVQPSLRVIRNEADELAFESLFLQSYTGNQHLGEKRCGDSTNQKSLVQLKLTLFQAYSVYS